MENSAKDTKTRFNSLAAKLGCKARIAGGKKKIEYQKYLGYDTASGHEVVIKITVQEFCNLTNKFPQLAEFE
jgi:hypothetical protein